PATAANAKVGAKRLYPVRRVLMPGGDETFRPIFFIFGKFNIYDVSGYDILDKDHFPVHAGQGFAFSGIIFNENPLQNYIFIFSTHLFFFSKRQR
ncbi:MAG TPA: hypothetical protein VHC48_09825, partial [Puia sp.]|nr:hypothetical protein [Puia sp.]